MEKATDPLASPETQPIENQSETPVFSENHPTVSHRPLANDPRQISADLAAESDSLVPDYSIWMVGICFLALSFGAFSLGFLENNRLNGMAEIFPISYLFVIAYFFILLASKRLKWWIFGTKPMHYDTFFVYLALWLTSCFALNRSLPIFNESVGWLNIYLVLACAAGIAYRWKDQFSPKIRAIWLFSMAASAVLMAYFSIYLSSLLPASAMLFWFFGLPLHSFVPLVFCIHLCRVLWMEWRTENQSPGLANSRFAITAGLAIPLAVVLGFVVMWHERVADFGLKNGQNLFSLESSDGSRWANPANITSNLHHKNPQKLPDWVIVSQHLHPDWVTERVLKSGIYYQLRDRSVSMFPEFGNNDLTRHDPLVLIADAIFPSPELIDNERVDLLRTLFDGRHELQERLWTGRDLATKSIETVAEMDPAARISYTEKTLEIRNSNHGSFSQQEAFYTFYLSEGAAVTSLSLWINGVEEPSRLAGKSRADSAYKTIVGRERRDPALVHWQEGNTVTVRVFPCSPTENRRFKIGVTAPLRVENDELVYENFSFQGPPATFADENFSLKIPTQTVVNSKPNYLSKDKNGSFSGSSNYRQTWEIRFKKPDFQSNAFSFHEKNYRATAFQNQKTSFQPEPIFLDLNAAWDENEVLEILKSAKNAPVFAVGESGDFEKITAETAADFLKKSEPQRFTVFPFHLLENPEKSLVISKNAGATPMLSDLKNSPFGEAMAKKLPGAAPVRVYFLGKNVSQYFRSLAEFRVLQLHRGDLAEISDLLKNGQFYENPETENTVVVPGANLKITENAGEISKNSGETTISESPKSSGQNPMSQHLMRLFAYNNVLRQIGANHLTKKYEPENLVREAEEAFVVTPVSSLVVLETEADYERFGISKNMDSLGNASNSGSGSVPEPHEWVLIGLLFLAILVAYKKSIF